jgi:pyruvate dehydrogenase E2 component (dihydrolipoamide acetyltransferase)
MSIPSHYLSTTVELGPVQSLRKALASQGTKISVNDCIVRAAALALAEVPAANAFWDANAGEAVAQKGVDVAVAVATPGGLLTPVVTNAVGKGLLEINREVADLAGRARANKLKPEEFTGQCAASTLQLFARKASSLLETWYCPLLALLNLEKLGTVSGRGMPAGPTSTVCSFCIESQVAFVLTLTDASS